jgi:hypothetical protein
MRFSAARTVTCGVPWKIAAFFTASGNCSANHRAAPTPV